MNFSKIVPSAFGPFIGHHQGLFACVKSVFKVFFLVFLITLQNYVNAKFDKTEILMTSNEFKKQNAINGNRILSKNIEY